MEWEQVQFQNGSQDTKINIMIIQYFLEFSEETNSNINFNYDLKKSNWFNIGGKTKVYFKPKLVKFS